MSSDPGHNSLLGTPTPSGSAGCDPTQASTTLAGTVHDLRNMLTVVLGSLEQLRRQPLDARGREQLQRAEWGARHAGQLAQEMFASAHGDAVDAAAEILDLSEAVRAFASTFSLEADSGARLAVELAPGPLPVRLDRGALQRALFNLVRNAADAMAGGGQVTIRTAGQLRDGLGGELTVEVAASDTGTGMAPEVVRHATEAFYTTKGSGHGSGLGLWMTQRFAVSAGGKVAIETTPGQGTTVRLVLPRVHAGQRREHIW